MGRKSSKPGAIPHLRVRVRSGRTIYFYDHGGKPRREECLGSDYGLAIKRWAEIERETNLPPPAVLMFRHVCDAYRREVIPTKAARTQKDNAAELVKLLAFFDDPPAPLESIKPQHVKQYLDWRAKSPVRAVREKALLSHIWNFALGKGYTDTPNPCAGIKAKKSPGRSVYIEDEEYQAIWDAACQPLRDAMDLAYLTGQRPADVLKMRENHIRDGHLFVEQNKTGERERIAIIGELAALIARLKARKAGHPIYNTSLITTDRGRSLSLQMAQRYWQEARRTAKVSGNLQFRDLRAKAGTDKAEAEGLDAAQRLLGHKDQATTKIYIRRRLGSKTTPTR